jgi:hypothetical protein
MTTFDSLPAFLAVAVPIQIEKIRAAGIVNVDRQDLSEFSSILGAKGDLLLFGSKRAGEQNALAQRLAYSVAVLSFAPHGVNTFGLHFEASAVQPVTPVA